VGIVRTDISEVRIASIIGVERIRALGTTLGVKNRMNTDLLLLYISHLSSAFSYQFSFLLCSTFHLSRANSSSSSYLNFKSTNTCLLPSGYMFGKLHLGKVAFTDGLEQLVFADVRLV
jgi:hypothetical protein